MLLIFPAYTRILKACLPYQRHHWHPFIPFTLLPSYSHFSGMPVIDTWKEGHLVSQIALPKLGSQRSGLRLLLVVPALAAQVRTHCHEGSGHCGHEADRSLCIGVRRIRHLCGLDLCLFRLGLRRLRLLRLRRSRCLSDRQRTRVLHNLVVLLLGCTGPSKIEGVAREADFGLRAGYLSLC